MKRALHPSRWIAALLVTLAMPCLLVGEEVVTDNPYKIKAAFLRNFAHYVTWPAQALPEAEACWQIGILGRDPFGQVLDATLQGRSEQGRPFKVIRAATLDQLPNCQIIYIAYPDPEARRSVLRQLRSLPVLTVGDAPEFLQEGGTIRFWTNDHVEMGINLDQARAASLVIQTKMLEVTREVVENGEVRKKR